MTAMFLFVFIVIESIALAFTAWRRSPIYLRKLMLVQMILISLFAPKLFDIAGFQSNVGSVFYATVFAAQVIVARRWSMALAMENVWTVLGIMLVFYMLVGVLGLMPAANDHDAIFTRAVSEITSMSLVNSFAALGAFVSAQFAMLAVLGRFKQWWAVPLAVVFGQVIDSAIFYPIVFHTLPIMTMVQVAVDGLIAKLACAVAFIPAYLYAVRKHPDDYVVRIDRQHVNAIARRSGRYPKNRV